MPNGSYHGTATTTSAEQHQRRQLGAADRAEEPDPVGDAEPRGERAQPAAPRGRCRRGPASGRRRRSARRRAGAASASMTSPTPLRSTSRPDDEQPRAAVERDGPGSGRNASVSTPQGMTRGPARRAARAGAARPPRRGRWRRPGRRSGRADARGRSATAGLVSPAALVAPLDRAERVEGLQHRDAERPRPRGRRPARSSRSGRAPRRPGRRPTAARRWSANAGMYCSSSSLGTSDGGPGRHVLDDVPLRCRAPAPGTDALSRRL